MEVKIFTKILKSKSGFWPSSVTSTDRGLAAEINLWLASKPDVEIKNITQSQSGGSWMPATIVVSVWSQATALPHSSKALPLRSRWATPKLRSLSVTIFLGSPGRLLSTGNAAFSEQVLDECSGMLGARPLPRARYHAPEIESIVEPDGAGDYVGWGAPGRNR